MIHIPPLAETSIHPIPETLRLLDLFLPRINFGRKVRSSPKGREAAHPVPGDKTATDTSDFPYLKRDLVRLLGILCHNRKAIQDRIRLCGGIPVVLNLCTIDDRNPCKFLFGPRWPACCFLARARARCHSLTLLKHAASRYLPFYVSAEADNKKSQTCANMPYLRCEIYFIIIPRTRPLSTRFRPMNTWDLM